MSKYYVTMTDSFMSGWGMAKGKINKLVFECDSLAQARIVVENAENRGDQKYINIAYKKPYYSPSKYYAQYKTINEYESWYKPNYFRKAR